MYGFNFSKGNQRSSMSHLMNACECGIDVGDEVVGGLC